MPRDYARPFKQAGRSSSIELASDHTTGSCYTHGILEPCIICADNRRRELLAEALLERREWDGEE